MSNARNVESGRAKLGARRPDRFCPVINNATLANRETNFRISNIFRIYDTVARDALAANAASDSWYGARATPCSQMIAVT